MSLIQKLFSATAMLAAAWIICSNWYCVVLAIVKRRHSSWVPVLGGGVGCLGCYLSPCEFLHTSWWLPLLLDWGCVPGLTYSLFCFLFFILPEARRGKK
jgi:hypothetical protein